LHCQPVVFECDLLGILHLHLLSTLHTVSCCQSTIPPVSKLTLLSLQQRGNVNRFEPRQVTSDAAGSPPRNMLVLSNMTLNIAMPYAAVSRISLSVAMAALPSTKEKDPWIIYKSTTDVIISSQGSAGVPGDVLQVCTLGSVPKASEFSLGKVSGMPHEGL
jgi:hypothetical protein